MNDSEETLFDHSEYVLGMSYTHDYHDELDPLTMSFLSHWKRREGVNAEESFNYFELGCGNGITVNVLAAANPHGSFYANDFNPEHCRNTIALSKEGGVGNLTVLELSFEALLECDLPQFDFICLHGILSWISDQNRGFIVEFLDRFLAKGGIVYLSYNCAPGNAGFAPVQKFLRELSDALGGPFEDRVTSSFNFLWKAKDSMPFFKVFENEKQKLEKYGKKNRNYVVHELFNYDWKNFYHKDLAVELSNAKLEYFAARELIQNFPEYLMSADLLKIYNSIESDELKIMFEDLASGKRFRKDLYIKERGRGVDSDFGDWLKGTRLVATKNSRELSEEQSIPLGTVRLDSSAYRLILEALVDGPKTLQFLSDRGNSADGEQTEFLSRVNKLIALGFVKPCFSENLSKRNSESADRFNLAFMGREVRGRRHSFFASPLIGTGVYIGRLDQHFIVARREGLDPVEFAFKKVQEEKLSIGNSPNDRGRIEVLSREEIERRYRICIEDTIPRLRHLGIQA